jgi:hypothetical protein
MIVVLRAVEALRHQELLDGSVTDGRDVVAAVRHAGSRWSLEKAAQKRA